jgi:hypothetical protein
MSNDIAVGIDCADLELRTAYVAGETLQFLPVGHEESYPAILFEPRANTSLGVRFPAVLRSIGSGKEFTFDKRRMSSEELVTEALAAVRRQVRNVTGGDVGSAAFAIPSTMSENRRTILLQCAHNAGFKENQLIDQCTAAAIGFQGDRESPQTILVVDVGYGESDQSVVRAARDKCKVLATNCIPDLSIETYDAKVIESLVLALRERGVFLGLKQFTGGQWLLMRDLAEQIRTKLIGAAEVDVDIPTSLTSTDEPLMIRCRLAGLLGLAKPSLDEAQESIHKLLEDSQYEADSIDAVVIVGDADHFPGLRSRIGAVFDGNRTHVLPRQVIVAGAACRACAMCKRPTPPWSVRSLASRTAVEQEPSRSLLESAAPETTPLIELLVVPAAAPPPVVRSLGAFAGEIADELTAAAASLTAAVKSDDLARARDALAGVMQRAREVEDKLRAFVESEQADQRSREAPAPSQGRMYLEKAKALLRSGGNPEEAVRLSHQAYELEPQNAAVFTGMMQVHADAALALDRPEQYSAAIRFLSCAYNHDQTDRTIHQAMAQRHYQHAVVMQGLSNRSMALSMLDQALKYNPRHPEALALLAEIEGDAQSAPQPN